VTPTLTLHWIQIMGRLMGQSVGCECASWEILWQEQVRANIKSPSVGASGGVGGGGGIVVDVSRRRTYAVQSYTKMPFDCRILW
jgi:hypothetical protein